MILFAADQVAGAEYLVPLLARWQTKPPLPWRACASARSAALFQRHDITCTVLSADIERQIEVILDETGATTSVFSTSANSVIERALRASLRRRCLPAIQFVDNWTNYALRFVYDGTSSLDLPDTILTIDSDATTAMIAEGIPAQRIQVVGQPYFEACYRAFKNRSAPSRRAKRGLLVTQPIAKYFAGQHGFDEQDFLRCCLRAWRRAGFPWDHLDIVVHPEEDRAAYRNALDAYSTEISILDNAVCDVLGYGVVLGVYSSLLVQAVLAETPALSVEPRAGGAPLSHLVARGLIPRARDVEETAQWLRIVYSVGPKPRPQVAPLLSAIIGSCDRLEGFLLAQAS